MKEIHHEIRSFDGTRLFMYEWQPATAPEMFMVVAHGLGGHSQYYRDSIAPYATERNIVVYAPDMRGHGKSAGVRGDVEDFTLLLQDLGAGIEFARRQHPDLPFVLLGESMGTPISINYVARSLGIYRPEYLILAACVVAPKVKPRPAEVVRTPFYAVVDRKKIAIPINGREAEGSRDPEHIEAMKTDPLFNKKVSTRFLFQMTGIMNQAVKSAHHLTMPTIILQGGKDISSRMGPTKKFFERIPARDKAMHVFPDSFHTVLNDPDSPQVRAALFEWLEKVSHRELSFTT